MVKEITAKDLEDWQEPFERILSHMYTSKTGPAIQIPEPHKQKLVEDAYFLKSLYDRSGVVVSNLNRIIEIDKGKNPSSHMEFTCKLLGFRGEYNYKKFDGRGFNSNVPSSFDWRTFIYSIWRQSNSSMV